MKRHLAAAVIGVLVLSTPATAHREHDPECAFNLTRIKGSPKHRQTVTLFVRLTNETNRAMEDPRMQIVIQDKAVSGKPFQRRIGAYRFRPHLLEPGETIRDTVRIRNDRRGETGGAWMKHCHNP